MLIATVVMLLMMEVPWLTTPKSTQEVPLSVVSYERWSPNCLVVRYPAASSYSMKSKVLTAPAAELNVRPSQPVSVGVKVVAAVLLKD